MQNRVEKLSNGDCIVVWKDREYLVHARGDITFPSGHRVVSDLDLTGKPVSTKLALAADRLELWLAEQQSGSEGMEIIPA